MAAVTHNIKLSRFERQPWGFRLHGGADFATPLLIQLVKADSLSEAAGLQAGDLLIAVNGQDVQFCRHKEAQDCIVRAGNNFELTIQRGGALSQTIKPRESSTPTKGLMGGMGTPQGPAGPGYDKWGRLLDANSAGTAESAEEFTKQFMSQLTGNTAGNLPPPLLNGTVVPTNSVPEPVETVQYHQQRVSTPTKQSNGTLERGRSPRVVGQYNTPQAMYSEDSLQEVLDQQAGILANGVKGIDFTAERGEGNLAESATLRLVQEMDNCGGEQHEPGPQTQPLYRGLPPNKNVQSHSFKMLQAALGEGTDSKLASVGNVHNVQAPKIVPKEPNGGGSRIRSASPAPSYSREVSSPNKAANSTKSSTPASASASASASGPGKDTSPRDAGNTHSLPREKRIVKRITVRGTENPASPSSAQQQPSTPSTQRTQPVRPTSSQGRGFQWPPPQQEVERSTPFWNSRPSSRTSSPAPAARAPSSQRDSPASFRQTQPQQTPVTVPIQQTQQAATQLRPQKTQQQESLINVPIKTIPPQQQQQGWGQKLAADSAGAATNAADFTKNFLSQLAGGSPPAQNGSNGGLAPASSNNGVQTNNISSNGVQHTKNQLHNPGPDNVDSVGSSGQSVSAPRRGRGVLQQQQPGMRTPVCGGCQAPIRGPFITAMGKTWCPGCFLCSMDKCQRSLQEVGFVEEKSQLYCEDCYGRYLAPDCSKCRKKIIGNCLKAMGTNFHPECFACAYCNKILANCPFYLEDGLPYCEEDWNELFTTKCVSCGFPIEAGDRWVEAINNNYHSQCFNCSLCKKNLEGQSFFVKSGKPFCKTHARG